MNPISEALVAGLIVVGGLFVLLGSIGLARLPDLMTRLHGPTKATTLGVGALLLASAIFFSSQDAGHISLHELAIVFFLFLSAPVTAHLIAKAALHRGQAKHFHDRLRNDGDGVEDGTASSSRSPRRR